MYKRVLPFLFLLLLATQSHAYMLRGVVKTEEGEPIAYASVYIQNTTNGVVTNLLGEYFFELPKGSYNLVFQSLGYEKKIVTVEVQSNEEVDVVLVEAQVEIETVQLTAKRKDPAYDIMKKVIERKDEYVKQFESYQCETYLKVSLEREKYNRATELAIEMERDSLRRDSIGETAEPVDRTEDTSFFGNWEDEADSLRNDTNRMKKRINLNFIESHSTTYFDYPNKYKSVVHAYRDMTERMRSVSTEMNISPEGMTVSLDNPYDRQNPLLFYTDVSNADFNFYRNLVDAFDLSDRPLISPLSSTAWRIAYKFSLEDQFLENGKVIYKIRVEPRLQQGPYFDGHIFIVDKEWAIKSVNLKVVPGTLSFFSYFQVIHQYEKTPDSRWVLTQENYYYNAKSGKRRYYGHTIAMHSDYQLDVEHPKNWFRNELRRVEDEARDRDSLFWVENRPITLKKKEIAFIHERDSLKAYWESPEYLKERDSIYNEFKIWDPLLNGISYRNRQKGMRYYLIPLVAQLRPFGVGGYRHAIGGFVSKEWTKYNRYIVSGELNYGFNNRDLKGYGRMQYVYNPKRFASAYIKYGNNYSIVNNNESISAFLSRSNYINKVYYGMGHVMEVVNGLKADIGFEFADRTAITDLSLGEWSQDVFGSLNDPVEFQPYREFLVDINLTLTPFNKYYSEPNRKINLGSSWPTFTLQYKKAIPGIFGSEINFDYLEVGATDEFRPGTWGISRWSFRAGRFLQADNIRFTDFRFFRGSDPFFFANPLRAMQLLGPSISTKNGFIQANYLHDFGGMLLDKVPLLNRTSLQLTGGGGVLFIEDDAFLHTEIYGGLQIPFTLWKQRFKFGTYYVTSYSNLEKAIDGQVKFGITFFNSQKNSWQY